MHRLRACQPILAAALALGLATPLSAIAAPKVGDTLACHSADPARHITVVVGRIDVVSGQSIVSISLHALGPDGQPIDAAHLPIGLEALQAACPSAAPVAGEISSEFEGGYAQWREAFDSHQGGYFTISVDQIVDLLIQQLPHPKPVGSPS